MKKVVIIGPAHPYRGGIANFTERLSREFILAGYEVTIITFTLQYPGFLFPGTTQFSSEPAPKDLKIIRSLSSINPLSWKKTINQIKRIDPELVLGQFWLPFMAPSIGKLLRKSGKKSKTFGIVHNMIPHEKRPGDMRLIRYFANSVDAFVAMSQSVLDDIKKFDNEKPKVFTPHPIYDNFGKSYPKAEALRLLDLDPEYKYILFFGFIRDYKGLDLALKAMADPRMKEQKIKLIVAGEFYTDSKPYNEIIGEFRIADQVVLKTDFIPDSQVGQYFCAADIIVQPYKTATQSGVTQIAYHFEKPMIVTNVGGLPEIVPDGKVGYVVEKDPKQISDAVIRYYDEADKGEMLTNIREEKKKYGWDHFVIEILKLADKVKK